TSLGALSEYDHNEPSTVKSVGSLPKQRLSDILFDWCADPKPRPRLRNPRNKIVFSVKEEVCTECSNAAADDAFFACIDNKHLGNTHDVCAANEEFLCCFNEATGIDCLGDPITRALLECMFGKANVCEGKWACGGASAGDDPATTSASGSTASSHPRPPSYTRFAGSDTTQFNATAPTSAPMSTSSGLKLDLPAAELSVASQSVAATSTSSPTSSPTSSRTAPPTVASPSASQVATTTSSGGAPAGPIVGGVVGVLVLGGIIMFVAIKTGRLKSCSNGTTPNSTIPVSGVAAAPQTSGGEPVGSSDSAIQYPAAHQYPAAYQYPEAR
ncbi:unnamed protein product, partial [Ectocarpus sp. 8 AP-2014]